MAHRLKLIAFVLAAFFLVVDNLRRWGVAGTNNPISLVFDGLGHQQFGWGMYSFDLPTVSALKVRYTFEDGESRAVNSSYGFIPSALRTPLGNFDPSVVGDSSGTLALAYASYLCRNPGEGNVPPTKVAVIKSVAPMPRLLERNAYGFEVASDYVLAEKICS